MCNGFVNPGLTSYLNENNNLIRLSFVFNNNPADLSSNKSGINYSINSKLIRNASLHISAPFEEEISQMGFPNDLELINLLTEATMHPKLEVIQIV